MLKRGDRVRMRDSKLAKNPSYEGATGLVYGDSGCGFFTVVWRREHSGSWTSCTHQRDLEQVEKEQRP